MVMKVILILGLFSLCFAIPVPPTEWSANMTWSTDNSTYYSLMTYYTPSNLLETNGDFHSLILLKEQTDLYYYAVDKFCVLNCWNNTVPVSPGESCTAAFSSPFEMLGNSTLEGSCLSSQGVPGILWTTTLESGYTFAFCFMDDQTTPLYIEQSEISGSSSRITFEEFVPKVDSSVFAIPSYCNP
eukprot:TRINITY_DN5377_c0_g1_i1.p1 TRINITY_DN5377_c0_g1~~TRINITY_DN5377_c0_g1_i1.p1  ORF type:complete len:185 (-),score=35.62 TRINITY_DN5377_c0_g1_i1:61-615(-)